MPINHKIEMPTENIGLFDFPDGAKGLIFFGKNAFVAEIRPDGIEAVFFDKSPPNISAYNRAKAKIDYWYFHLHKTG